MEQDMSIVVFNMLPTSVQSRLPAFRSLRRSTSLSILSLRRRSLIPQKDMEQVMIARSEDNSVVELQPCSEAATNVTSSELEVDQKKPLSCDDSNPNASSGVKWNYAAQGSYLQQSAAHETIDLAFARKSYIDGVAYMLKALPDDMDDYEAGVIRRALPTSFQQFGTDRQIEAGPKWLPSDRAKTFLHSTVQGFVSSLVLFAYLLLSFLSAVIRTGAHYERQYNISQHVVSSSFVFATAVGKQSGALSEKIGAISDGRLGKLLSDLIAWTIESVAGGVQDGIGQGLLLIEQRRK
ncbi:uncharacterized protein GGS22DRAFT_184499 [Annulohypoxylon maeteangense]|uniref:uncharacterized protein n=1 Tax=Annulohypoxylon maeteangense TaxID=1927788 RepID=UPI0020072625|nr:uncharacterized protein GGS22DRAFT_184499 [Annulohypoxylon maeteangense]KAI0888923.1 hypothetical protein GGS22DRAFT_184499 [Annulohypoxylon maeteangense]